MAAQYTIFQAALTQFGKQITDEMKATLQRNNNDNTGRLSNSIQSTVEGDKLITWFVTITIPHIITQYQRSRAFKKQEFIDLIERIVDNKLKQIINDGDAN